MNNEAKKLISVAYSSSSTSSLSEASGLPVFPPPITMSSEPTGIHTAERPLDATPINHGMEETARTEQIDEPANREPTETILLGVVKYANSSSSEESCGSYFNRQVALIEETRPPGPPDETTETSAKESISEPKVVSRARSPSPLQQTLTDEDEETPMEEETA